MRCTLANHCLADCLTLLRKFPTWTDTPEQYDMSPSTQNNNSPVPKLNQTIYMHIVRAKGDEIPEMAWTGLKVSVMGCPAHFQFDPE